jgi:hypothetical protein
VEGKAGAQRCRQAESRCHARRCAHFASSVWHEKRHFLDFLLTNYGAFRIRQFFEIYRNLPVLFNQTGDSKRILLPLDSLAA